LLFACQPRFALRLANASDRAGEFKSHAETTGQQLTKRLKETRKLAVKEIKEKSKQTGEIAPIPHFNVPIEVPASNVAHFPHTEKVISIEDIAAITPIPQSMFSAKEIGYWEAVGKFADKFADVDEAKEFLLIIFGDGEVIAETEIEAAIDNRHSYQQPTRLRAVK
jgi:hypothetical protein